MSFEHEEPDGQPEAEPRAKTGSPFSPEVHEALAALEREEPLSVAEEIASEGRAGKEEIRARTEQLKHSTDTHIAELQRMSMAELIEEARRENLTEYAGIKKQELIFRILKERVKLNGLMYGEGTLEVLPDGFGFSTSEPRLESSAGNRRRAWPRCCRCR